MGTFVTTCQTISISQKNGRRHNVVMGQVRLVCIDFNPVRKRFDTKAIPEFCSFQRHNTLNGMLTRNTLNRILEESMIELSL